MSPVASASHALEHGAITGPASRRISVVLAGMNQGTAAAVAAQLVSGLAPFGIEVPKYSLLAVSMSIRSRMASPHEFDIGYTL